MGIRPGDTVQFCLRTALAFTGVGLFTCHSVDAGCVPALRHITLGNKLGLGNREIVIFKRDKAMKTKTAGASAIFAACAFIGAEIGRAHV